jgi:hypothetical protein
MYANACVFHDPISIQRWAAQMTVMAHVASSLMSINESWLPQIFKARFGVHT